MNRAEQGELTTGDIVLIKGLKSEKGKKINGKKGTVSSSTEYKKLQNSNADNRFEADPGKALNNDGRYNVDVDIYEDFTVEEHGPSRFRCDKKRKRYLLKRENLELIDGSPQSFLSAKELAKFNLKTTAELEKERPWCKGIFPAIGSGDHVKVREIMEATRFHTGQKDVADFHVDGGGNGPICGAIERGHLACVEILLEFGADVNGPYSPLQPALAAVNVSLLHIAINALELFQRDVKKKDKKTVQKCIDQERIIELLLEHGADPNKVSAKGAPLHMLLMMDQISKFMDSIIRVMKMLFKHGADADIVANISGNELFPLLDIVGIPLAANEDRLEIAKLLLDHGADPGKLIARPGERANAIILAANYRIPSLLETLLRSEKGRKAVNSKHVTTDEYNGENSLHDILSDDMWDEEKGSTSRECIVILLKYGGDIFARRDDGLSGFDWIQGPPEKHKELRVLVKKAPKRTKVGLTMGYWDPEKNDRVKAFIGNGSGRQCPVCMVWSQQARDFKARTQGEKSSGFQQCSRCKKQWYCSRDCQKVHWSYHKRFCKVAE